MKAKDFRYFGLVAWTELWQEKFIFSFCSICGQHFLGESKLLNLHYPVFSSYQIEMGQLNAVRFSKNKFITEMFCFQMWQL